MHRAITVIAGVIIFLISLSNPATAQDVMLFEFRGESLSTALDQIIKTTDIDLVYDPQLIKNINVYKRITAQKPGELLRLLLENHQLDYITLSSGTYVIVKSVMEGPFYGTFAGKVVDSQTGEPLPGATVMLADASGGTSANRSGNFSLNKLLIGSHRIIFSYVGYEPVSKTIEIRSNNHVPERIELDQKPVDVLPVVVEAHQAILPRHSGSSIKTDSRWETVGVMKDAVRSLSMLPGVQYGLPMSDLHLQGGQHSEHRLLLDGVPVYNPYSFGRLFSSFSPYAIGNVTLHKAGYGVKEGSQIAGLIDLAHDLPMTGEKSLILQGDPLSANLRGDLSFQAGNGSSFHLMTAFRTNFWDIYKEPTLKKNLQNWNRIDPLITNTLDDLDYDASIYSPIDHDSDIDFFDYHLAAGYEIDEFNSLSASLYLAENAVETRLLNQAGNSQPTAPAYLFANDGYEWKNISAQLTWNKMVTPRFDFSTQASYSANRFEHQNRIGTSRYPITTGGVRQEYSGILDYFDRSASPIPTQIDGNNIRHFIIKTDGSYSMSPHFSLQGGLQFDRLLSGVDISDLTYFPAHIDQSSSLLSSYVNSSSTFGNYWNLELGSRFTYSAQSNNLYTEPRFSVQYDKAGSNAAYWSARISGGLYRQFINEYQITNSGPAAVVPSFAIWSLPDEETIPKAWHLNGSYLVEPVENFSVKMELFYKWQPVTNITSYGNLNSTDSSVTGSQLDDISAFSEAAKMTAAGGGLRLNHSLKNSKIKLMAGYDYSYTRVNMDFQFGRELPAPWNEPHRARFQTLWRILPDLTISAQWLGIWGRTWAFRSSYYNYLRLRPEETPLPVSFDSPENDKLSPFHQVDLSFIYQPAFGPSNLEMRIEFINLLNRKNTLEKYLYPVLEDGEQYRYDIRNRNLPGFYPTMSLQVKF